MTTIEPATPEAGPTDTATAAPAVAGPDFPLDEILDAALRAAYPAGEQSSGLPHETLVRCLKLPYDDDTADRLREQITARQALVTRILAEVAPRLYGYWQNEAATRAAEHAVDVQVGEMILEGGDGQNVAHDTLRAWAVWCDQIATRAAGRRADAAWGARHVADQIRRELAHPRDIPDLAAFTYRDERLFDRKRALPATGADDQADLEAGDRG